MATQSNITSDNGWFTGEDKNFVFTIYQEGTTTPQDITGWTLSWLVKLRASDADAAAVVTKTTSAGIALTTPVSGVCTVSVADTDTDAVVPRLYVHELKRMDAGFEVVLSEGTAVLKQAAHRT